MPFSWCKCVQLSGDNLIVNCNSLIKQNNSEIAISKQWLLLAIMFALLIWFEYIYSLFRVSLNWTKAANYSQSQCCIQLAMGKLKPDQLTESVLSLVSARPRQQLTDSSLLAMVDDSQQNRPSAEIIKMMMSLSDRATYAQQCCTTIIICFRLAVVRMIWCWSCVSNIHYIYEMVVNHYEISIWISLTPLSIFMFV